MILKLYRITTKIEKEEKLKFSKLYKPSQLISKTECSKITIGIIKINDMDCINSILVDGKMLLIKEWENLDFLQVFKDDDD